MPSSTKSAFEPLSLVAQISSMLPSGPKCRLYAERDLHASGFDYKTPTLGYVLKLLAKNERTNLIVLTGDAGQGKTHLCRRLLERAGLTAEQAFERLRRGHECWEPIELPEIERTVRIVHDLAELDPDRAACLLVELLEDEGSAAIVGVNEGLLREVCGRRPAKLGFLLDTLEHGRACGDTADVSGEVHVISLNAQTVAPLFGMGFVDHLLNSWTSDEHSGRACGGCRARVVCPILRNRERFAWRNARTQCWSSGLTHLIRTVEQSGYVLTFRETLILCAYLLTGGLSCAEAIRIVDEEREAELANHHIEHVLFERDLSEHEAQQLPVLARLRRYDPGRVALWDVDAQIIEALEGEGELGAPDAGASAMTHEQLCDESSGFAGLIRARRREAFFDVATPGGAGLVDHSRRLGLEHYPVRSYLESKRTLAKLIAGLHVVQGVRPPDTTEFNIIDPACARSGQGPAVIVARLRRRDLRLRGLSEQWRALRGGRRAPLTEAVDWLDRGVVLCDRTNLVLLELSLIQLELLLCAGEGVTLPGSHAAERRRLLRSLAELAERRRQRSDAIRIVVADASCEVFIDRDGSITIAVR